MKRVLWSLLMIWPLLLAGCGKTQPSATAQPAPVQTPEAVLSGTAMPSAEPSAESAAEPSAEVPAETQASGEVSAEPSGEASPEPVVTPAPTPSPTPVPAPEPTAAPFGSVPGTYTGEDGSELVVEADGTVKYTTEVSGKINGSPMAADLTFHGAVEGDGFLFDKVTYKGIDLTAIAAANGITDASPWQEAARQLYLAQQ